MAGLTQYFFLTTFCWMSVEAVGLYRAVVLVFTSASNKTFLIAAAAVAWGEFSEHFSSFAITFAVTLTVTSTASLLLLPKTFSK